MNIDAYIDKYPKDVQKLLKQMRAIIKKAAPKADQTMGYGIPTFKLNSKNLVHFGGFKKHIGFFPTPDAILAFKKEFSKYTTTKGTVQLPLEKPLPVGLITKVVKFRVKQVLKKEK